MDSVSTVEIEHPNEKESADSAETLLPQEIARYATAKNHRTRLETSTRTSLLTLNHVSGSSILARFIVAMDARTLHFANGMQVLINGLKDPRFGFSLHTLPSSIRTLCDIESSVLSYPGRYEFETSGQIVIFSSMLR